MPDINVETILFMSIVKSLSVGNGDMFYIQHNSDNFTVIDCFLSDENKKTIMDEIISKSTDKNITRFISTHPDEDHIKGLEYFNQRKSIVNFYCVENEATKEDESDDFKKYCELRDSDKAFYIKKGCSRKWMNKSDEERGSSGINIHWPIRTNPYFIEALEIAKDGGSPNNISPIISYSLNNGVKMLWMGDLETEFMDNIQDDLNLSKVNILFAPHHGRDSGKVPCDLLEVLDPDIIIIGECPSKHLNYYCGYNTITQNLAGNITFHCTTRIVHIYVSNNNYSVDFLKNEFEENTYGKYIGSLDV